MVRAATAGRDSGACSERRRKVECYSGADARVRLLRTIPGVRAQTVGSNRGAAGPAAAVSQSQSNKWLYRNGTEGFRFWGKRTARTNHAYQRLSGGKKARKKIAIVAVGRKLLVRCWAMLRDNRAWDWQPRIT